MTQPGTGSGQGISSRLRASVETATRVLTDPKGFYGTMPKSGGFEEPGLFAGIMLVAGGIVLGLLSLVRLQAAGFFVSLVLTPVFGAIGLLVGAAILFLLSRALGGQPTFESSFRIAAYASALFPVNAVLTAVPFLPLLVSAYGIYIAIVAVIAVSGVPEQRAWTVLGGLGALLLFLSLAATLAARRAASRFETLGIRLEKNAEEVGKAAEQWSKEMEKAVEQTKKELERRQGE